MSDYEIVSTMINLVTLAIAAIALGLNIRPRGWPSPEARNGHPLHAENVRNGGGLSRAHGCHPSHIIAENQGSRKVPLNLSPALLHQSQKVSPRATYSR